jgi:hypothetical protein
MLGFVHYSIGKQNYLRYPGAPKTSTLFAWWGGSPGF